MILLAVVAAAAWFYREELLVLVTPPCTRPITYDVEQFDAQFGVSREYFLSAIKEAETVWEKPLGRELFMHDPEKGRLKINLIYDYRQETTEQLTTLGSAVDINKATYDSLKARLDQLKAGYDSLKATYDSMVRDYRKKPSQAKFAEIKSLERQLNLYVEEMNSLVPSINRLANQVNTTIEKYNTIGLNLGEFEEGLYHFEAGRARIDIYEFKDRPKLVRVMAHEFGHALNLDHVEDPRAIMFSYNKDANMVPTEADLRELKAKCGIK